MALGGALGLGLGARDAAAFCVAGAAHTHIYRHFAWAGAAHTHIYRHLAWQARHTLTSTSFCVAGVAQTHIYRRFAWQGVAQMAAQKLTSTFVFAWFRHVFLPRFVCFSGLFT